LRVPSIGPTLFHQSRPAAVVNDPAALPQRKSLHSAHRAKLRLFLDGAMVFSKVAWERVALHRI
jgi:hypothetical protein